MSQKYICHRLPQIIIVLGPPGSGKGTQADLLRDACGMEHFSPGSMLRELAMAHKKYSPRVSRELAKMKQGKMVGHWLVYEMMFPKILSAVKAKRSVIIDGAIRTLPQAFGYFKFFREHSLLPYVHIVWLSVSKKEAVARMMARKRIDDNPKVLAQRFKVQGTEAQKPVLAYLKKHFTFTNVDGSGTVAQIHTRVVNALTEHNILRTI